MSDTVKVTVDRDSVAMGDDVDSHREFWVYPASATIDDLLIEISTHYVPGIAGPAGWCVFLDNDDRSRHREIGLIYSRDDLGQRDHICRLLPGKTTVSDLAKRVGCPELGVYASYLTFDEARPWSLDEVEGCSTFTGCRPTKLESEAAADANRDWVLMRELDRLARSVAGARRDWVRANLLAAPPPWIDIFIARNFHYLTELHCPASMSIAAKLLGVDGSRSEDLAALAHADARPNVVTLAMVLAAFEWGTQRGTWREGERAHCKAYLELLAHCGYRLSPIEQVMAGHISVEQLKFGAADAARLDRIRQLRDQQYQLRMSRYYAKTLTDEQYQAAIGPVHAELSSLGELPGPM
ncbi:hypothetical protein [Mycobacterium intracellulare]|uniref:hypothetical protein n=1 Tax=Mycobacterium intracellulare TaxID=1767 RepID=UPI001EEDFA49|nr:hypothetical protein [Mycobacterium intracellulare]MEE3750653.1 hypothetical protein [Mycobacterium intracellulare]